VPEEELLEEKRKVNDLEAEITARELNDSIRKIRDTELAEESPHTPLTSMDILQAQASNISPESFVQEEASLASHRILSKEFERITGVKLGSTVRVLRTSGELEDGWRLGAFRSPDMLVNKQSESKELLQKAVKIEDLARWNR